jgi:hypothetical protein
MVSGKHADFRGCLELRAHDPGVDPFVQHGARGLRGLSREPAQLRVVGIGHGYKTAVAGLMQQRRLLHQVQVIGEQHQAAGRHVALQAAGSIRLHEHTHTQRSQCAQHALHRRDVTGLVGVLAPAEHQHVAPGQAAGAHESGMSADGQHRKARQFAVGDVLRLRDFVGHAAPAGAQQQRKPGLQATQARADDLGAPCRVVCVA